MAYFSDLSSYSYCGHEPSTVNIGWLDGEHPFNRGETSPQFRELLAKLCENPWTEIVTLGVHTCEICEQPDTSKEDQAQQQNLELMRTLQNLKRRGALSPEQNLELKAAQARNLDFVRNRKTDSRFRATGEIRVSAGKLHMRHQS
jgi:hypothetical protein